MRFLSTTRLYRTKSNPSATLVPFNYRGHYDSQDFCKQADFVFPFDKGKCPQDDGLDKTAIEPKLYISNHPYRLYFSLLLPRFTPFPGASFHIFWGQCEEFSKIDVTLHPEKEDAGVQRDRRFPKHILYWGALS